MKKLLFVMLVALAATGCKSALDKAIDSSSRPEELRTMLAELGDAQREDMEFLIVNMLDEDRNLMSLDLLKENVEYATMVREKYEWAKALPKEVYQHDVLPFHVVDEVRDAWRKELYEMFAPAVDTCKTMYDAVCAVNANIPQLTGVHYLQEDFRQHICLYEIEFGLFSVCHKYPPFSSRCLLSAHICFYGIVIPHKCPHFKYICKLCSVCIQMFPKAWRNIRYF